MAIEPKPKQIKKKWVLLWHALPKKTPRLGCIVMKKLCKPLSRVGELHLDIIVDRMRREFG